MSCSTFPKPPRFIPPGGCSKGVEFQNAKDGEVWERARLLREKYWERKVYLRGVIEFSNYCCQNCLYCGLRRDNKEIRRYRLSVDEILDAARQIKDLGYGTAVLVSGEDPGYSYEDIALAIRRLKNELGLAVTLSLGERSAKTYADWLQAGADRYLLKLETLDPDKYVRLRPGRRLEERLNALNILRDLGYELGSGFITGLPGEDEDIVRQGLECLASLKPDIVSLSPFTPHPATPLKDSPQGEIASNLLLMAEARILMPYAHIPVSSLLELYGQKTRLAALEVGNTLMPSLASESFQSSYESGSAKNGSTETPEQRARSFRRQLLAAGFELPSGPGSSWRLCKQEDA